MIIDTMGPDTQHDAGPADRAQPPSAAERSPAGSGTPPAGPAKKRRLNPRTRRRLLWAGAAAVLVLLLVYAFTPSPIEVEAAPVVSGPLETTINADGVTRVHDRYQVTAPISGRVERIALREGDVVEAGAVIARITPAPLDPQALLQAQSRVAGAQALVDEAGARVQQTAQALEQARRTTARIREVAGAGGLSVEARERAELELSAAEREHEAARSRARAAASELSAARAAILDVDPERSQGRAVAVVRAPAAGRVLRVPDASERVVAAGTPLAVVGDPAGLEVVVDVLSTDAVRIQPGAPMRLVGWGGEGVIEGRVRRVEPSGFTKVSALGVEEQRVNVIGDLFDPPAALGDGYRAEARIVTWSAPEVLKVPTSALFRTGEEWSVFMVEDGRARLRTVQIGQRGAAEAQVLGGLAAGEPVILFPSDQLADGVRVEAR